MNRAPLWFEAARTAARQLGALVSDDGDYAEVYFLEPHPDTCGDCHGTRVCRVCEGTGVRPEEREPDRYEALRRVVVDAAEVLQAKGETEVSALLLDAVAGF